MCVGCAYLEFLRGDSGFAFEHQNEVGAVVVSQFGCYVADGHAFDGQHLLCPFDFALKDVVGRQGLHLFLEQAGEVAFAQAGFFGEVFHADFLVQVLLNHDEGLFDAVVDVVLFGCSLTQEFGDDLEEDTAGFQLQGDVALFVARDVFLQHQIVVVGAGIGLGQRHRRVQVT